MPDLSECTDFETLLEAAKDLLRENGRLRNRVATLQHHLDRAREDGARWQLIRDHSEDYWQQLAGLNPDTREIEVDDELLNAGIDPHSREQWPEHWSEIKL